MYVCVCIQKPTADDCTIYEDDDDYNYINTPALRYDDDLHINWICVLH